MIMNHAFQELMVIDFRLSDSNFAFLPLIMFLACTKVLITRNFVQCFDS